MGVTTRSGKSTSNAPLRRRGRAPATSFDRFNYLPKELRCMIWKAARPRRILHLHHHLGPNQLPNQQPSITIRQPNPQLSGEAWDGNRRDYTTITSQINGVTRLTSDLLFNADSDTLYISNHPLPGATYYWGRLLNEMCLSFNRTYPKHLAINWSFININNIWDFIRFAEMEELCVVVGSAATKTRTKTLVPGQPVKFGRGFRGKGTQAELLARVGAVEALMMELVRRNVVEDAGIPVVKIMMLCEREL